MKKFIIFNLTLILVFCFGNLMAQTVTVEITFQADMTDLIAQGFDPDVHEIELRGEFNNWEGGDVLQAYEADENFYFIIMEITGEAGSIVEWKFKARPEMYFVNNGWELDPGGGQNGNRQLMLPDSDEVLSPVLPEILFKANLIINSTSDAIDSNPGDGICDDGTGHCTLRAAIEEANAYGGEFYFAFDIPGTGPHTFQPFSTYEEIWGTVTIDGTTEPDFDGTPIIELDGTNAGDADGLSFANGYYCTIKGLVINRFANNGIALRNWGENLVVGNYIGTDITGADSLGNGNAGIYVDSDNNTIGGTTMEERNIISGNLEGIAFDGSSGNVVQGNFIGTDVSGTSAVGNGTGILVLGPDNTIGGEAENAGNLISGNEYGISIGWEGVNADNNLIVGNFIGTDVTGTVLVENDWGIHIRDGASNNIIGGTTSGARNLISGNTAYGIAIEHEGTKSNHIMGNYIGTDISGTMALGGVGIVIAWSASENVIGGPIAEKRNLISGNEGIGIWLFHSNENIIQGNYIGVDASGLVALPNDEGIYISNGASNNFVGGTEPGARNIISGNEYPGISIGKDETDNNTIQGNYIGTDVTGNGDLGNGSHGIEIWDGASGNLIGGEQIEAQNTIAYNEGVGILVNIDEDLLETVQNKILCNSIFSNSETGIDLSMNPDPPFNDGVTPNDPGDADTGPNNLQNFPDLSNLGIDDNEDLWIYYFVDSEPVNSVYPIIVQFFKADDEGEGQTYLGADTFSESDYSSGMKQANLGNAGDLEVSNGDLIVATATDDEGNTSEFSPDIVTGIVEPVTVSNGTLLLNNYPNPFSSTTRFEFTINRAQFVTLTIHDSFGKNIETLVDRTMYPGNYSIIFDGSELPNGVYYYRLHAGNNFAKTRKMILSH